MLIKIIYFHITIISHHKKKLLKQFPIKLLKASNVHECFNLYFCSKLNHLIQNLLNVVFIFIFAQNEII